MTVQNIEDGAQTVTQQLDVGIMRHERTSNQVNTCFAHRALAAAVAIL